MSDLASYAEPLVLAGEERETEETEDVEKAIASAPKRVMDLDAMVRQHSRVVPLRPVPHPDLLPAELPRWDEYRLLVLRLIIGRKTDREIQEHCRIAGLPEPDADALRSYRLDKRVREWIDFDEIVISMQGLANWTERVEVLARRARQLMRLVDLLDPMGDIDRDGRDLTKGETELLSKFFARKAKEAAEDAETEAKKGRVRTRTVNDPYLEYSRELRATLQQLDEMQGRRHQRRLAELHEKNTKDAQKIAQKAIDGGRGAIVILPASDPDPFVSLPEPPHVE